MNRTALRTDPDKTRAWQQRSRAKAAENARNKPRKPLAKQSAAARNDEYALSKIKKEMVRNDPKCRRCGIEAPLDLHHRAGRSGYLVTHRPLLTLLCRICHELCSAEPAQMMAEGWIVSRHRDWREEMENE